jgi:HEAT repeat protein
LYRVAERFKYTGSLHGGTCLGSNGPASPEALPALIQALKDREPLIRDAAVDAIGCIGLQSPDAVIALEKALTDSNSFVQATAAKALKKIGAVPAMIREH